MKKLNIGDNAFIIKRFSTENVKDYLALSGDTNPIHYDKEYALTTPFRSCIVPGLLVGSLFGGLLGSKLPGNGTIHIGQTMYFKKPVFVDEVIKATIEIINIRIDKPIITFSTVCHKGDGTIAIEGEAVVKYELNKVDNK
jgi:acyl dehydratase